MAQQADGTVRHRRSPAHGEDSRSVHADTDAARAANTAFSTWVPGDGFDVGRGASGLQSLRDIPSRSMIKSLLSPQRPPRRDVTDTGTFTIASGKFDEVKERRQAMR